MWNYGRVKLKLRESLDDWRNECKKKVEITTPPPKRRNSTLQTVGRNVFRQQTLFCSVFQGSDGAADGQLPQGSGLIGPGHGLRRRRGRAVAMREGAARPGGARDPRATSAPDRLADDRPGETRIHDVRDVQHLASLVAYKTVQVAEQVRSRSVL